MARLSLSHWLTPVLCAALGAPVAAWAQAIYARVLEATPIYEPVNLPQQDCTDVLGHSRCAIRSHTTAQIIGFEVRYEYQGHTYTQRMAHNPGPRVRVQTSPSAESYNSAADTETTTVVPGQQSYSSSMPGAPVLESIQYPSAPPEFPVFIDLSPGHPPRR